MQGKILAIDYGIKRIGLAVSDEVGISATALPFLKNFEDKKSAKSINVICKENNVSIIIIGLPLGLGQKPTQMSNRVKKFIVTLQKEVDIEIITVNETLTTQQALINSKQLKYKKKNIDSEAAKIMLQEYLNYINETNTLN